VRVGKGIEEENKVFFCSASKFPLKEEKKLLRNFFGDESSSHGAISGPSKRQETKNKLQLLTKNFLE
jgi:hypothetical protein